MQFYRVCLPLVLLVAAVCICSAQDLPRPTLLARHSDFTTEGTEFWVVFQKNFRDYTTDERTLAQKPADALQLELFITSSENVTGYVDIHGLGFHQPFTVAAGKVISIPIDTAAQVRSSEKIEDLAVHIVADHPIAVYGLNRRYQTTDTYLAHPVNVLGTSYRAMCYAWLQNDLLAQVAIIGTQDNTHVKITPSCRTQKGKPGKQPFEVVLNRGDVYQVIPKYDPSTKSDLTGSLIESDKPVSVFSGHNCAYVPDPRVKACNLLVEQLPSIKAWGRQFFVGTLAGRSSSVIRVLANEDSTHVFENNHLVATLGAGEFYENKNQSQHTMVTSDRPVLVAQYSKGFDNGDDVGDPMMIVVAPTEQFLPGYRIATPVRGSWHHYMNLIVPTRSIETMRLDEQPIDRRQFRTFGLSLYSIAQIEVAYGTHVITGDEPFGLYSYGFGYDDAAYDAYGNGGGQSMDQVVQLPDTIPPMLTYTTTRGPGREVVIAAIARDDRVNDKGIDQITVLDHENVNATMQKFEPGVPQVPIAVTMPVPRQNAYIRLRLRDKAGNTSTFTICAKYEPRGDSMRITLLHGSESCDFSNNFLLGGYFKYSGLDNNVELPVNSTTINNPVVLKGNHGQPVYGFGAYAEQSYGGNFYLTGRVGFDFHVGNLFGYWPDSLGTRAQDGTLIIEEFHLHRLSAMLTLSPGAEYYFAERKAYVFGLLNVALPLITSETFTRTILRPGNYVYQNGTGTEEIYSGSGPSGLAVMITPEIGIGAAVEIRSGWRIFGELGIGTSLTSASPGRDWTTSYITGRGGAKIRF
ncbi:MAG TPA: IgGFc-binding protein [Candidatus Kapabacteria bacterium]|nr:IgGFc-binding protein [Candidatus Kapabacteria bacterium]